MNSKTCIERMKARDVKPTAVRILVLEALLLCRNAVSVADLEAALVTVDKSTIFRTLNLFLEHHLVHAVDDGSGSMKYEVCEGADGCSLSDMHVHFHCEACNRTLCLKSVHLPDVGLPPGYEITSANYTIKGLCDKCSKRRQ